MIKMFDKNTIIMFLNREHLLQSSLLCLCVVVTHTYTHISGFRKQQWRLLNELK